MPATDTQDLISEAKCYICNGLVSLTQAIKLALLARILVGVNPSADVSAQGLLAYAKCYACYSPGNFGDLMEMALLDQISQASGGGAASCENLEGLDSPLNVVTPDFVGQVYVQGGGTVWQAGTLLSDSWVEICGAIPAGNGLVWGPNATTLDSFDYEDDTLFGSSTPVETISLPTLTSITDKLKILNTSLTDAAFESLVTVGNAFTVGNCPNLADLSCPVMVSVGTDLDISGLVNLVTFDCPLLQTVGGDFNLSSCSALVNFNPASVTTVTGQLNMQGCASLVTVSFPLLTDLTGGDPNFLTMPALQTLSFPSLTASGEIDCFGNTALTSVNLTALITATTLDFNGCSALVSINFAALVTATGSFNFFDCTSLASVLVPNWVVTDGTTINLNNCALSATSVELILRRCVLAGVTTCTIDLSGGANAGLASLSAQGQADAASLTIAGNTVSLNP